MTKTANTYSRKIADRLRQIMNHLGLTVPGFAVFINRESSHIYGILNLSRDFNDTLAEHVGKLIGLKGATIKNINTEIPVSISKCSKIIDFKKIYKDNPEYFLKTKIDRSIDVFISEALINSTFLDEPKYLSEIEDFIRINFNKVFVKDSLSKALRYATSKKVLNSEKKPIRLKNGQYGQRLVDVYWKNK